MKDLPKKVLHLARTTMEQSFTWRRSAIKEACKWLGPKTNFVRHYLDDLEDDRPLRLLRFGLRLLDLLDEDLDDDLDEPDE